MKLRAGLALIAVAAVAGCGGASHPQRASLDLNGRLPQSALAPIAYPEGAAYLRAGSIAAAWNTMNWCATRDGVQLLPQVSNYQPAATAYRDYATQVLFRRIFGSNAAIPGTSNHGLGRAVDVRTHSMRSWTDQHGGAFGFTKATSDASWEWWHLAAAGVAFTWTAPDPGPDFNYPVLRPGSTGICIATPVDEAQRLLHIGQTGNFGHSLARHVLAFKRAHRLRADTTISRKTWDALRGGRKLHAVPPPKPDAKPDPGE